jgi:diguanylate cyclase (GGDEF)-like protein
MDKFKLIKDFSKELTSTLELKELANVINHFSVSKFGAENSSIMLPSGKYSCSKGKIFDDIEEKTFEYLAKVQKPISIANPSSEYMFKDVEGIESFDFKIISLPLSTKGKFLGALNIYFSRRPDDDFMDFLKLFTELSSSSIMNSLAYRSLETDSITDELTSLYNRRSFESQIAAQIEKCSSKGIPISVMMADIDNFKEYNDMNGHQKGDEVLADIGKALSSFSNITSFRYGGEEFTIILQKSEPKEALEAAEEIRKKIESSCSVTVSIGLATCLNSSCHASAMVKEADSALYKAKKSGKNQVAASVIIDKSINPIDVQQASELGKKR